MDEDENDEIFENMAKIEEAFSLVFKDSVKIMTREVRHGSNTSNVVYVPKRYAGCPVTLIIWDKLKKVIRKEDDKNVE